MNEPISLRLATGHTLLVLRTARFKSETFTVQYAVPLDAAQQLTAVLALLARGSRQYPAQLLLSRKLDELYSTILSSCNRKVGDMHVFGYSLDFLARRFVGGEGVLPEALAVLSDVLYDPLVENGGFRADYTALEKNNIGDAIRAEINNPRGLALARCRKLLCAGEPYARSLLGEADTLDALTPHSLYKCYRECFLPQKPVFFYAGAEEPERVAAWIEQYFPTAGTVAADYRATARAARETVEGTDALAISQGRLALGFRSEITYGHPLDAALLVLNELFGGSPASKLFLNVREARGLCYSCMSSVDLYKGVLFAQAGMKPANRGVTEEAMLAQLDAIRAGEVSESELHAALASLDFAYRQTDDMPATLADIYVNRLVAGLGESRAAWRARIAAVKKEDVVAAAAQLHLGARYYLDGTLTEEEA